MNPSHSKDIPPELTAGLKAILGRIRRLQLSRALLGIITISLAGLLAIMAADFFCSPLDKPIRWTLFIAWLCLMVAALWKLFWKPLSRRIELLHIARWLEVKHPELEERLSTSIELSTSSATGISESLVEEIIHAATSDIKSIQPRLEVQSTTVKRWLAPAILAALAFSSLLLIWPAQTSRLLVRAIAPFSHLGNTGAIAFEISPGDLEVVEGDPIEIKILYQGKIEDTLILETTKESGETTEEQLTFSGQEQGKQLAIYRLANAREGFDYRIRAGRSESDSHRVTVWPKPRLTESQVRYEFPAYTGWAPELKRLNAQGIKAIVGTKIQLSATTNTPIQSASLLLNSRELSPVQIDHSSSGDKLTAEFQLGDQQAGTGNIQLQHRLGHLIDTVQFPIKAHPDKAPVVRIISPSEREFKVRPNDQLSLNYHVSEDIGLSTAHLISEANKQSQKTTQLAPPNTLQPDKKNQWQGAHTVHIAELLELHPKARQIQLKIRVLDNRPETLGGPGVGESETITLKITHSAPSLARQEIDSQQSDIRETGRKARDEIRQAKERMDWNRENIKKEELPQQSRKQLEEARKKLSQTEQELNKLAKRMEKTVHAPKAEQVAKAAEQTRQAREQLETAPLEDQADDRRKKIDQARQAADEAMKQLDDLLRKIDQDRQKLEDLAKLQELAQKESELARQMEKLAQQQERQHQPTETGNKDQKQSPNKKEQLAQQRKQQEQQQRWQQQQQQIQEELRQAVTQRPDAMAETSKQQAEQARKLARQADALNQQQEKLKQVSQQHEKNQQAQQAADQARQLTEQRDEQASKAPDQHKLQQSKQAKVAEQKATENANRQKQQLENAIQEQLEREQETMVQAAKQQLEQAQQNSSPAADTLPEAIAKAKQSQKAIQEQQADKASEMAKQAADQLEQLADSPNQQGEPQNQAPKNTELTELAERQEQIAEAMKELAEGKTAAAMQSLQELQADATRDLANAIQEMPHIPHKSGQMQRAEQQAQQADNHAHEAARISTEQPRAASDRNQSASKALAETSKALEAEAKRLDRQAGQAMKQAQQQAKQAQQAASKPEAQSQQQKTQAPVAGKQLAEAFLKASEASQTAKSGNLRETAEASRDAAEALEELAQQAKQNMQAGKLSQDKSLAQAGDQQARSEDSPAQQAEPAGKKPGTQANDQVSEKEIQSQADPGVPPELAKLGVSSEDWEKLSQMLRSDVGSAETSHIPEDYRQLVQQYFQQMATEGKENR